MAGTYIIYKIKLKLIKKENIRKNNLKNCLANFLI